MNEEMDVDHVEVCSESNLNFDDLQSQIVEKQNQNVDEQSKMFQLFERTFQSREELLDSVKNFYLEQGYATSIKNSRKDRYVTIQCDRGGNYRNRLNIPIELRQKITSSRLTNCPFEIRGKRQGDGFWILELKNGFHNHEPSKDMSGHPSYRHLSKEEKKSLEEMTRSGIPPRQILSSLRQKNPNLPAISRTLYNMKAKINRESLGGRTMIRALFDELGEGGFRYDIKYDQNGHLTHLFFAHPSSIMLAKSYSTIFVMDCTYKTNRYKMPLLDIIGVSSFNTSFYSGFAFLEKEGEADYVWALNAFNGILGPDCQPSVIVSDRELALMKAIQVIFPRTINLLCVWHIEKNILSNCKSHFGEVQEDWNGFLSTWNAVIYSLNEFEFEENWKNFELLYKEKKGVVSYIQKTWLPFKERFVNAWTEKYLHFRNRVSSRAEGAHAKLKQYLLVSTCDLRQVKDKICLAIDNEFQEIKTQLESERLRTPHNCNIPFFKELVNHVSMYAMRELHKQYVMLKYGTMQPLCTGHFMATMGLPCAHKMKDWKDGVLPLYSIHPQWRLDTRSLSCTAGEINDKEDELRGLLDEFQKQYQRWSLMQKENAREKISQLMSSPLPPILEPNVQPHKGRPLGSKKRKESNSTTRDPSQFEIVEKTRRCGICKDVGHNSRTCQAKTKTDDLNPHYVPGLMDDETVMDFDLDMVPNSTDGFLWD